jgi:Ca2+-binding EF-hand superfamily protein
MVENILETRRWLWCFTRVVDQLSATNEAISIMKTTPVSRIALISALSLAIADAQDENRPPREDRPAGQPEWGQHDANGDGSLSLEEFRTMPRIARLPEEEQARLFKRLDTNSDGKLEKSEIFRRRPGGDHQRPPEHRRRIMELDANRSGGVSLDEMRAGEMFSKMPAERLQALFKRLDTDGDGEITPQDRPELPPDRRRPGPPPPGRGNREPGERGERGEPGQPPPGWHRRMFAELDADQSGGLSFGEFRKARPIAAMDEDAQEARFMRLDANADKSLDHEEFAKMPAGPPPPPGEGRRGPPPPPAEP